MISLTWSAAVRGGEAFLVRVEADLANGLPRMCIVGLPDGAVREARERVVSAVRNSGYEFPDGRVTVGLAPAAMRKGGAQLDLPMALGVLAASGQLVAEPWAAAVLVLGELALDGSVLPVANALPLAAEARSRGLRRALVPAANAGDAAAAGLDAVAVRTLCDAALVLGGAEPPLSLPGPAGASCEPGVLDLADVRGQSLARRALEIAAAGGHNLLFVGPPGTGKSMMAARLPGLLPPLSPEEAVETARLHALAGLAAGPLARRPFRAPHSAAKPAALLGGADGRPGELSLAHAGVLFLDELPEFPRDSLECLRQPLEERVVRLARAQGAVEFPADCLVAAAMNPCPCGRSGQVKNPCRCLSGSVQRYRERISGPLLDRLDLRVELAPIAFSEWLGRDGAERENSAAVRERVLVARAAASARGGLNARLVPAQVRRHCAPDPAGWSLVEAVAEREQLSARGIDRVLRVARTIADLDGAAGVERRHVGEALQYRGIQLY